MCHYQLLCYCLLYFCTLHVGLIICAHVQYVYLSGWQQGTLHGYVHVTLFNCQGIQFVQQLYSRPTFSAHID
jgi:hypothetical protein